MFIHIEAKAVDANDCINVQRHLVCTQSTRTQHLQDLRKNAALQKFPKNLAVKGLRWVGVALPVEMDCTGQRMPGLEESGNRRVQQRMLKIAWGLKLGFGRF